MMEFCVNLSKTLSKILSEAEGSEVEGCNLWFKKGGER